jgi:hypothetical protein
MLSENSSKEELLQLKARIKKKVWIILKTNGKISTGRDLINKQ